MEHLMFKGDEHVVTRSTMASVLVLDRVPTWDRLVEAFDRGSRLHTRLRERIVTPLLPIGRPQWYGDPDFDLNYHLRRISLASPGTDRQLLDMVVPLVMSPLDRLRPLWEATLVEGLDGGRAALVLKAHHALTDGLGGVEMLRSLLNLHRDDRLSMPPQPAPHDITPADLTRSLAQALPRKALDGVEQLLPAARSILANPSRAASGAVRAVNQMKSLLGAPPVAPSPLMRRRGLGRRITVLEIPLADMKAAGKVVAGSVNDVYLAALGGALRRYHDECGVHVDAVPAAVPVSIRSDADRPDSNQWTGVRLALPVAELDPLERVRLVGQAMSDARDQMAPSMTGTMSSLLSMMPGALLARLASSGSATDVQASNIPASPVPLYLAGAELTAIYGCGPLPGQAMMAVMASYRGTCFLTVNYDTAAITDAALFDRCLRAGFDEFRQRPPAKKAPAKKAVAKKAPAKNAAPASVGSLRLPAKKGSQ